MLRYALETRTRLEVTYNQISRGKLTEGII